MDRALKTWGKVVAVLHDIFRRHWRRALIVRDWFRLSEEALHLLLASLVGVIGGLTNWIYFWCNQLIQYFVFGKTGDLLNAGRALDPWQRLLIPTLGGLAAGLVLYLGLRLLKSPGLTNLLEVIVAGDGRLRFRTGL